MELNETFMDFLEREEGLRLLAYDDKRPNYQLQQGDRVLGRLTIGYGHTGDNVFIGQTISKQEAMASCCQGFEVGYECSQQVYHCTTDAESIQRASLFHLQLRQGSIAHFNTAEDSYW
jgi:GH24 family phage-related lysozyme (muramidase)